MNNKLQQPGISKQWTPDFFRQSPIFSPLLSWAEKFNQFSDWPGLDDYQNLLEKNPQPILTKNGLPLKIVKQEGKPGHFTEHYAPRIFLSGEIQTRTENWHDFFQFLTWFMFPKTKAEINAIHIPAAQERIENKNDPGRRSPVENMLSLFDEGGAVILSSDASLLTLIREFKWKELFWQRREQLETDFRLVTFGHALYEKGLAPYLGMTANCILLHVPQTILALPELAQLAWLDTQLAEIFQQGKQYQKPKDLSPFPLLGLPGWDVNNEVESYYDNKQYFREGRK